MVKSSVRNIFVLGLLILAQSSCGIKGKPLPPEENKESVLTAPVTTSPSTSQTTVVSATTTKSKKTK